jgi:hypothetical protein
LLFSAVISAAFAASPGEAPLQGFVDSFAYGYAVTVSVNGTPITAIRGDGQQATRLFAVDHPMRAQGGGSMAGLFVLREGENTIAVQFQKKGDARNALQVKLEVPGRYDKPLFHLDSSKRASGKVEKKFVIERKMAPSFATIEVNDGNL